ncbi:unnamed protein product [Effrenium voratum]|uniref:Purple acid phosphatase n=1 Tax=Effrenium voratum TaxID=2562239 RepID=A0AA36IDL9_9DINO|nr:unnamed protein product [Effrenium voratum]
MITTHHNSIQCIVLSCLSPIKGQISSASITSQDPNAMWALLGLLHLAAGDTPYQQPEQIHIGLGLAPGEMTVHWSTIQESFLRKLSPYCPGDSFVMYGLAKDELNRTAAGSHFLFQDYGDERRNFTMHIATMTDLLPNRLYYYIVGGNATGWSAAMHFKSAPVSRSDVQAALPMTYAVFGDQGDYNGQTLPSLQMAARNGELDMVLHVGDMAYDFDSDNGRNGDAWMRDIEPLAATVPYMVSMGNHEASQNFNHYTQRFRNMPSNSGSISLPEFGTVPNNWWYSWNHGLIHFLTVSTEVYFNYPNMVAEQYVWLEHDLAAVNRSETPWLIVHGHRPLYCSCDTDCDADATIIRMGISYPDGTFKHGLEELFYKYGVDLYLAGHEHDYERMFDVSPRYDPATPWLSGVTTQSTVDPPATTYIITGSAGNVEDHEPFTRPAPSRSAKRLNTYGWSRMTVHNASHLLWQQLQTDSGAPPDTWGQVVDEVWVVQRHHGPFNQHPRQNLREKGLVGLPEKGRWQYTKRSAVSDQFDCLFAMLLSASLRRSVAKGAWGAEATGFTAAWHLGQEKTAEVITAASKAMVTEENEVPSGTLHESVLSAARGLHLSKVQVERLSVAMASLDHKIYARLLQVLKATAAPQQHSTAEKVAEVVSATANANFTWEQVADAAAAAAQKLTEGATTTLPLQGLAEATMPWGPEAMAAVVAAAGDESPRSQLVIADMFRAARESASQPMWSSGERAFGSEAERVAGVVRDAIYDSSIPEQEKRAIVEAVAEAATVAEKPGYLFNGTEGMDPNLQRDLLALSRAARSAGFSDHEVARFKVQWQGMTPQQRGVAKHSLDALVGRQRGNSSTEKVAAVVKALENAGLQDTEEATYASWALRSAKGETQEAMPGRTALEQSVEDAKSAGLSGPQLAAMVKAVAALSPEERQQVVAAWAAVAGKSESHMTMISDCHRWKPPCSLACCGARRAIDQSNRTTAMGFTQRQSGDSEKQVLEELSVVAYSAIKAGLRPDLLEKADGMAQQMSPYGQMKASAAILQWAQEGPMQCG